MTKELLPAHPYFNLPAEHYWKSAVADRHVTELFNLYKPKFKLARTDRIAVAGSCFAQHVGHSLRGQGFCVLDAEPAPDQLDDEVARRYGYRIYSARYGNIYTGRQLLQLVRDAEDESVRESDFWLRDGRVFDALRPNVEPEGLGSIQEASLHRSQHLRQVKALLAETDLMIFTLGLTEAWACAKTGVEYPTCPGVIAGTFDPSAHQFVNHDFSSVLADMVEVRDRLKAINPELRLLLTVSPVPLTATASGQHVLVATTYSKSVLRAVAGSVAEMFDDVDYFPSYELIASPAARGFFYEPNLRSVNRNGVAMVMGQFLGAHAASAPAEHASDAEAHSGSADGDGSRNEAAKLRDRASKRKRSTEDVICEEELLGAFAT